MTKVQMLAIVLFAAIIFFSFTGHGEAAGILAIFTLATMIFAQVFTRINKDN